MAIAGAIALLLSLVTSFVAAPAAGALTVIPDTGGYDQIDQGMGAQQDIAGVGIDGATFSFAWDETSLSGNNSSDMCSYFQEDDGTVNAVCYSVQFEPDGSITPGFPTYDIYDCGTTYGNGKCTGNNPVSTDYVADCGAPVLVNPYFPQDPDQDLEATCTLVGLNGNNPLSLQYINTCTKPSGSPSSLSNDCIFDPGAPDPGFLRLVKVVADGPAQPADFVLTASNGSESVSGAGDTDVQTVPAGDYNLSETSALIDDGSYQLDGISCVTDDGDPVDESDGIVTVNELETTVCTFTNSVALNPPIAVLIKGNAVGNDTVASLAEPGGTYVIPVSVTNTGGDATLTSLIDAPGGDVTQVQGVITATTCAVPQTLAAGDTYTCEFTTSFTGGPGDSLTDELTATLTNATGASTDSDQATVVITDVPASIEVVKTADPTTVDEPGANVTFAFAVNNTSETDAVTITSLTDSIYGDLDGQGTCSIPQTIAAGDSYSCQFSAFVAGNAGDIETNVVTASGTDDDGNPVDDSDDATVTVEDVPSSILVTKSAEPGSVPETGGDVTFSIAVENTSTVDDVTITTVNDDQFGDVSAFCSPALPATLAPGETITCTFTETIVGNAGTSHVNVATATGTDDDGNPVEDEDSAEVPFTNVDPDVSIVKTANPTSVPEPGGDVEFTIVVTNNSIENVQLDSLTDSDFDLLAYCGDPFGTVLGTDQTYTCTFTEFVAGNFGDDHNNVATVVASDDEGNTDTEIDDADVVITDVPSSIDVTKTASVDSVPETGGDVTFTFVVENTSAVDSVTITALNDSIYGDLNGQGDCAIGATLAPGANYTCAITETVSGDASQILTNVLTVTATDDDGGTVEGEDDATVNFEDVLPDISIVKTANPTSIDEPGALVEFIIVVTNDGLEDATITSLTDSDFDLAGQCNDAVGTVLDAGASYTCVFTEFVFGNPATGDHENTATVTASDDDGNSDTDSADEIVVINPVAPVITVDKTANPETVDEPGGLVTFTVVVGNESAASDPVTIASLTDDIHGDLNGQGDCSVPQTILPGDSYTCEFTVLVAGNAGDIETDVVTANGSDDEGTPASAFDDATVTINDIAPVIVVTKDGSATVPEAGGDATYTITVTNNSAPSDPVTVTSIADDKFGDLLPEAEAANGGPIALAPGESFSFDITRTLDLNAGDLHVNVVTVCADDDEGTENCDDDDHVVVGENVDPVIDVTKTPDQDAVFAPGEDVIFTIRVENNSVQTDPVTLTSIIDDVFGDVSAECVLPQTISSGGAFECDITRMIIGDHINTATVTGTDDEGTEVSDSDDATVDVVDPSLTVVKLTNGFDGGAILEGADITWTYQVTNDGDVPLTGVAVTDDQGVTVNCPVDSLAPDESTVCVATGTAIVGDYANVGTATGSYTDADGDTANPSDTDPSSYFGADPSVAITKTFADDSVIAGGAGSSFDLVVTNDGNVDLTDLTVTDSVPAELTINGVTGTTGADGGSSGQDVVWSIPALGAGESTTVTVSFSADTDVPETLGVLNTANVDGIYTDRSDNTRTIGGEASDTVDVLVDINLSLVKTFDPASVPQGTLHSFTLEVSNAGPSDAVDVSVTDLVDTSLDVQSVTVTSGSGDCAASIGQDVDCTVQIPAGESVTVTVEYLAAPFLGDDGTTTGGDTFRFVFANGEVLEGSTASGEVFLNGVDVSGDVTILNSLTRNDVIFDPDGPGGEPALELHLSCSDPFTGGWGQSGGPVEGVNSADYQVAFFAIARYNNNGYIKNCGNVVNPYDVDNTASASGTDSFGIDTVSDSATVTVEPGITINRIQTNGKRITVRLTNFTGDVKTIDNISVTWPTANGALTKIRLDTPTVWQGNLAPDTALLDASASGWSGGSLNVGEAILRFDFQNKSKTAPYVIRVSFTDGTFLDINN